MKKITQEQLYTLRQCEDIFEGRYWLRQGTYGLSLNKRMKFSYEQIGHCNDFRNKTLEEINVELFKPIEV